MKPIVFDIDLFDLQRERIVEKRVALLELYDTHLHYQLAFSSDHADDDDCLIWKRRIINQRSTILRKSIVAIHFFRHEKDRCWKLEIESAGAADSIIIDFKKEAIGLPVYNEVMDYIRNSDTTKSPLAHA